jgi:uncharacterized protein (TIGR02118 family)
VIKRITLAKRRADMSHAEFAAYWLGPHVEIARDIPRALGYVINVADDPESAGWDGVAEMWFASRQDAEDAFRSEPIASALAADRPKFLGEYRVFLTEEHVITPPPR